MITIKILTGPYAGEHPYQNNTEDNFDPMKFLSGLMSSEWRWEIDYSQATSEEKLVWFRADLANRIVLALVQGRYIQFMDQRWQLKNGQDLTEEFIGKIEDYIADSGFMVTIAVDDEQGLVIKTAGPEPNLN